MCRISVGANPKTETVYGPIEKEAEHDKDA